MALQIKSAQGLVEVFGAIHRSNFKLLQSFLESELRHMEFLTLSLERIDALDVTSAMELEYMYKSIARENKVLSIIGSYNQVVTEVMDKTRTSYILSHDRV